jgi:Na+-driven multidrug efflux pump
MGMPIFHFLMCIAAGIYIARKMLFTEADEQNRKRAFKKMARFCAAVMALICCLMTLWAIAGQMIGQELETPLLTFTFTVPIFLALVLTGGAILVLAQYWLTGTAAKVTFRLSQPLIKSKG